MFRVAENQPVAGAAAPGQGQGEAPVAPKVVYTPRNLIYDRRELECAIYEADMRVLQHVYVAPVEEARGGGKGLFARRDLDKHTFDGDGSALVFWGMPSFVPPASSASNNSLSTVCFRPTLCRDGPECVVFINSSEVRGAPPL